MNSLTDSDVLMWSKRLEESRWLLSPKYNNFGKVDVTIIDRSTNNYNGRGMGAVNPMSQTSGSSYSSVEPVIKYNFSYSITENRINDFQNLLEEVKKNKFDTNFIIYNNRGEEVIIKPSSEVSFTLKESTHKIYNRDFIRYSYELEGLLSSIIGFVSYLDNAINLFGMIWGYDADGIEHNLLKYPIGTIVSMKEDKSKDYLVIKYMYSRLNDAYTITYIISEIVSDESSPIIKYGTVITVSEDKLCFSRDSRINNILN
jgi:hypothetical protein